MMMGFRGRKRERWLRTAGVADDGTIFVASGLASDVGSSEFEVLAFAVQSGTRFARRNDRIYVPSVWFANVFPELADVVESIETTLREDARERSEGRWVAIEV